jgi:anti-sigma factor RsiW
VSWGIGDFLDQLEDELESQRRLAARHVDRAEALLALRNRALTVASDLERAITVDDVFASASNEQERAELAALADRILALGSEPASESESSEGYHLETGERL